MGVGRGRERRRGRKKKRRRKKEEQEEKQQLLLLRQEFRPWMENIVNFPQTGSRSHVEQGQHAVDLATQGSSDGVRTQVYKVVLGLCVQSCSQLGWTYKASKFYFLYNP